jgi:hypothetical protein
MMKLNWKNTALILVLMAIMGATTYSVVLALLLYIMVKFGT